MAIGRFIPSQVWPGQGTGDRQEEARGADLSAPDPNLNQIELVAVVLEPVR
jgi:hypothetical protein